MFALATSGGLADLTRLCGRLTERLPEIEHAALARVYGVSDPASLRDPQYVAGLRSAVGAGLSYGIEAIATPSERTAPVPAVLLAQAREAARREIGLDIVLRRYLACYTLLGDFIAEEAERDAASAALKRIQRRQAALLDRLLTKVADEYNREAQKCPQSESQRRHQLVEMLLAGELVDAADLGYELDAWHVGAISSGPGSEVAIRGLATALDRRLLVVGTDTGMVWAWLGGRRQIAAAEMLERAGLNWPSGACLALGEAAHGLEGWRVTHRQAKASLSVALRRVNGLVCHSEVALLAAVLGDELLATSLRESYLAPLEEEHDDGAVLRRTLRAYFEAKRNVSSAAAALGVARQTVSSRLRLVEERVGRPVESCAVELEIALRLDELTTPPLNPSHPPPTQTHAR